MPCSVSLDSLSVANWFCSRLEACSVSVDITEVSALASLLLCVQWVPVCFIGENNKMVGLCFSGYDFGYLLKVLTNTTLPTEEQEFFEMLKLYFCNIYDVKYLMKSCKNLKGGLQEVSEQLEVSGKFSLFRPSATVRRVRHRRCHGGPPPPGWLPPPQSCT